MAATDMGIGKPIARFTGSAYGFLSNFFPCNVTVDGLQYGSVEAAFQAQKSLDGAVRLRFTQLGPRQARARGRRLELRADWQDIKESVMLALLRSKFADPELRKRLRQLSRWSLRPRSISTAAFAIAAPRCQPAGRRGSSARQNMFMPSEDPRPIA